MLFFFRLDAADMTNDSRSLIITIPASSVADLSRWQSQ